jgi:large subunit ribosomal protein L17
MRHGDKINNLGRKTAHRHSLLANLASSLIMHKKINTTLAKAKALRLYVEPLLTKSKTDSTHSRRVVFSYLGSKEAVTELFREIAVKIAERPGGYTRILKTGTRPGDRAEMAFIELVDFNTTYEGGKSAKKAAKTTRRSRGKKKADGAPEAEVTAAPVKAKKAAKSTESKEEKEGE